MSSDSEGLWHYVPPQQVGDLPDQIGIRLRHVLDHSPHPISRQMGSYPERLMMCVKTGPSPALVGGKYEPPEVTAHSLLVLTLSVTERTASRRFEWFSAQSSLTCSVGADRQPRSTDGISMHCLSAAFAT